jgi:hypothetical protein
MYTTVSTMLFDKQSRILEIERNGELHLTNKGRIDTVKKYEYTALADGTLFVSSKKYSALSDGSEINYYYKPDSKGRIARESMETKFRDLLARTEKYFSYNGGTETKRIFYKTADKNSTPGPESITKEIIFSYDKYGYIISETLKDFEDSQKDYSLKYDYQYDADGNWTSRVKYYKQVGKDYFSSITDNNLAEYNVYRKFIYNPSAPHKNVSIPGVDPEAKKLLDKTLATHNFIRKYK